MPEIFGHTSCSHEHISDVFKRAFSIAPHQSSMGKWAEDKLDTVDRQVHCRFTPHAADETQIDSESVRLIEALVSQRTPRAASRTNNTDSGAKDSSKIGESAEDVSKIGEAAKDSSKTGEAAEDGGPIKFASKKVRNDIPTVVFKLSHLVVLYPTI